MREHGLVGVPVVVAHSSKSAHLQSASFVKRTQTKQVIGVELQKWVKMKNMHGKTIYKNLEHMYNLSPSHVFNHIALIVKSKLATTKVLFIVAINRFTGIFCM